MKIPLKIRAGRYVLDIPEVESYSRGNRDFRDIWSSRQWGSIAPEKFADIIKSCKEWDTTMARKTYRIELKIDFDDDTRHDALMNVAKQYARDLLGSAMLLQDGRKPACVLMTDDTFTGMEEIDILDPSDNLHEPEYGSSNG
jgi:hypothetical protein